MQIRLNAAEIWLASEPVDFRKALQGLTTIVHQHYQKHLKDSLYIFYNRGRNRIKCIGCHRQGMMMIYKVFDKRRFYVETETKALTPLNEHTLSWLLAGLDWQMMSHCNELDYPDYF